MPTPEKLKELLKEIQKVKLFEKIKSTKDIDAIVDILKLIFDRFSAAKGDKGDTPQKGVDYMTDKEFKQIADDIYRMVKAQIKFPEDGKTPTAGKDYPTHEQVETIIKKFLARFPIPSNGRDGANGRDGKIGERGLKGKDGSPDQPEEIRNKLISLKNKDRLPIIAIDKLQEELDKLKKEIGRKIIMGGGAGATGGHVVKAYDLSDVLNGSTKTFSLPAFWRVISVVSSSFPTAFRPTIDYTVDGTLFKITFTSEIDAATTLATGQTLILTYSE